MDPAESVYAQGKTAEGSATLNREMSQQRKKVVVLCAASAALSSAPATLAHGHPRMGIVLLIGDLVLIGYAMMQFMKLKRSER